MHPGPAPGAQSPDPPLIPERPSLCHSGCVHYHRLVLQADAAEPQEMELEVDLPESRFAKRQPNGRMRVRSLPVIHHEVAHYCYPSSGIEIVLGSAPVVECSRYERQGKPRFDDTHMRALKQWREEYAALKSEADAFDEMLSAALAAKEKTP